MSTRLVNLLRAALLLPATACLAAEPDLVPFLASGQTSIVGTAQAATNVTFLWGVTNQGAGTVTGNGPWLNRAYLSTVPDPARLAFAVGIDSFEQALLEPGAAGVNSVKVTFYPFQPAHLYLILVADSGAAVQEGDKANNVKVIPLTLTFVDPPWFPPGREYIPEFLPDGSCMVYVHATLGSRCVLEASTNLVEWSWVADFTGRGRDTAVEVVDPGAARFPRRFYRAVVQETLPGGTPPPSRGGVLSAGGLRDLQR